MNQQWVEDQILILQDAITGLNQEWARIQFYNVPTNAAESALKQIKLAQLDEQIEEMRYQLEGLQTELGAIYLSQGTEVRG